MIEAKIDRSCFEVTTFEGAEKADREYWRSRTPQQRLQALELMRRINYGRERINARIQHFFEAVELR